MSVPNISPQAQELLLMAERGEKDLQQWVSGIYLAWDELDIINQPRNYGYTAWTNSEHNQVFLFPQDYTPPNVVIREEEGKEDFSDFGQGTVIRYVPIKFHEKYISLFDCFYNLFPCIDCVETNNIGELSFDNPFIDLEEREEYDKAVFFERAMLCVNSDSFYMAWQAEREEIPLSSPTQQQEIERPKPKTKTKPKKKVKPTEKAKPKLKTKPKPKLKAKLTKRNTTKQRKHRKGK